MKEQSYMFFKKQSGFTLIELIIITGIILLLSGFITVNLLQEQHKISVSSSVDTIISDISSQQTKAMAGDTNGSSSQSSYGIYFKSDSYVLFRGTVFSANDPSNFTVMLDNNITITSSFSNSTLVFSIRSGQVNGFLDGSNTITIQSSSGPEKKTITINELGIVKNIN